MTETKQGYPSLYRPMQPSTEVGGFAIEGLEDMGQRDIVLPRKSIVQLTSKKSENYGQFYDNLSQETAKAIDAVVLKVTHTRQLWSGDPSDERPECVSRDNITGSAFGECVSCEFNADNNPDLWDKGMKRCSLGYSLLCVDIASDSMFMFQAMKTSAKPTKALITQYVNRRRPPFSFVTRFETALMVGDQGKYYVFKPSIIRPLDNQEFNNYREMYRAMNGVAIREVEDEIVEESRNMAGCDDPVGGVAPCDDVPFGQTPSVSGKLPF
jgi:hypothetical protein